MKIFKILSFFAKSLRQIDIRDLLGFNPKLDSKYLIAKKFLNDTILIIIKCKTFKTKDEDRYKW